jgi:hypothetical protein
MRTARLTVVLSFVALGFAGWASASIHRMHDALWERPVLLADARGVVVQFDASAIAPSMTSADAAPATVSNDAIAQADTAR